jgi:hypothetical protein
MNKESLENTIPFPGPFEIFSSNSPIVSEVFSDTFDITWLYEHKVSGSDQKIWSIMPGEQCDDDGTVSYKYNNEYFRSDDFTSVHSGAHVLFAGCSETEGQGGQIEESWGNILFEKLKQSQDVSGFYNLGRAGYGWQKVISQVRVYISKYGKPDNLFVLLPNLGRSIEWSTKMDDWYPKQAYPRFDETNIEVWDSFGNMKISKQSTEEYRKMFIDFVISWKLFEEFCKEANIKLVWGTWEPIDDYNFNKLNIFKNFVSLPSYHITINISDYRENAKTTKKDFSKRDGHHGILFHEYWANTMLKEAKRKGFVND